MDISVNSKGSFKTENFLTRINSDSLFDELERFAEEGVRALASATPEDSGETARSWSYNVAKKRGFYSISWTNSHMAGDAPVAILIQYGHGTGTGGYIHGRDFINPAIKPILDKLAEEGWKVVISNE